MAAKPEPRRRWYQFSLRTLLIGVALLSVPCAYVGHEARIVAARKAWISSHLDMQFELDHTALPWNPSATSVPVIRRWLGDEGMRFLAVYPHDQDDGKALFPEAIIVVSLDEVPY
jgi:hypothetical protein